MRYRQFVIAAFWVVATTVSCASPPLRTVSVPTSTEPAPPQPASSLQPKTANPQLSPTPERGEYGFPEAIDPAKRYLFYLHGKIIEDQGLPAVSPEFGEYQYEAILERFSTYGFVVISEQRPRNSDVVAYASRVTGQVARLLNAGVPGENITVVGVSKGAWIAIYVSHSLEGQEINYAILAICHPDVVENLIQNQIYLNGIVLSIYDSVDEFAGSCQELFAYSEGKGIDRYEENVLKIGTGHGILYKPLDEWVLPVVQWAGVDTP